MYTLQSKEVNQVSGGGYYNYYQPYYAYTYYDTVVDVYDVVTTKCDIFGCYDVIDTYYEETLVPVTVYF